MRSMKTFIQACLHVKILSSADPSYIAFCVEMIIALVHVSHPCPKKLFCSVELTGAFSPTDIGIWEPHTQYGAFPACAQKLSARCKLLRP